MLTENEKKIVTLITLERQDPAFNEYIASSDEIAREEIANYKARFTTQLPMLERMQTEQQARLDTQITKLAAKKALLEFEA